LALDSDVLRVRGTDGDDFDSAIQGSEWDQFLGGHDRQGDSDPLTAQ